MSEKENISVVGLLCYLSSSFVLKQYQKAIYVQMMEWDNDDDNEHVNKVAELFTELTSVSRDCN